MSSSSSSSSSSSDESPRNLLERKNHTVSNSSSGSGDSDSEDSFPQKSPATLKRKHHEGSESEDDNEEDSGSSSGNYEPEANDGQGAAADVSVLSHKEQRRQKKKAKLDANLKNAKSNGKLTDDKQQHHKRQNSVWVGNLSFKTTPSSLKSFFEVAGEVTRVHMPMKAPPAVPAGRPGTGAKGENRGFAYVDFTTPEAKVIAISMSEKNLDGRRLLIKDGGDFAGRPAPPGVSTATTGTDTNGSGRAIASLGKMARKILAAQKQPPAPTLFLGNLGFETTEASIRELIVAHVSKIKAKKMAHGDDSDDAGEAEGTGEKKDHEKRKDAGIRKIRLGTFEDSGNCKGFAFVDFLTIEGATAALINPRNHLLDGRKLVVEYASADAVRRGGGGPRPPPGRGQPRRGGSHSGRGTRADPAAIQGGRVPSSKVHEEETEQEAGGDTAEMELPNRTRDGRAVGFSTFGGRGGKGERPRHRAKPGAALALAQREKVAIVPSEGTRLKFT
ncbi:hypothetical protein BD410DRAFT_780104 [Rickenella mellea]|uniref:RRM domain-containing protein n=1 Tax=Rickenella mellea TaxID=50990 RepID=A0A4R5XGU7_9AGAM|nr:hypothetical protein BD410DRAFT_780104 [Rickenella mellea]